MTEFATPQEAETAFYDAFQRGDLEAMMQVWVGDDSAMCIHPGTPRIVGRAGIEDSWRQIFGPDQRVEIRISDQSCTQDALLAIHVLRESLYLGGQLQGVVSATNVYLLADGGWHMLLHHASGEPSRTRSNDGDDQGVLH